jgi:pyruvate,water dikinase
LLSPDEYVVYRPLLEDRGFEPIIGRTKGAKETKLTSGNRRGIVRVETNDDERGRFVLDDNETLELARWAAAIEDLFEWPVCIEWAKDGLSGELFVVEARPQTVEVKRGRGMLRRYELKSTGEVLVKGTAIGAAAIVGKARIGERLEDAMRIEHGEVLVTRATDPKWLPVMRKARAMIADSNNPGSHADEACRELGLPAVMGTGNACSAIESGEDVTVSCAEGSTGYVYKGRLELEETPLRPEDLPDIHMGIMLDTGSPDAALRWWNVAADGICPARTEFLISNFIGIHPMALIRFDDVRDEDARDKIADMTRGYEDKTEYFIDLLAQNIAQMAASLHPRPVIVRFSDFQGDGYAGLIGGRWFESAERIPATGLRGASRYVADFYRPAFELECLALKRVRDRMGFSNVGAMIPFCRTPEEADAALEIIESQGLKRTDGGFQVYMMVEVPSNMVSADQLAARFDGLSIAVAGPTGFATGADRGRDPRTRLSGEMKRAIPNMVLSILNAANDAKIPVGFHAAPLFDDPESVEFLVGAGVNFISVGPDRLANVIERVAAAERPGSIGRLRREK